MASGFSFTAQQKEKLNDAALRYYIAVQSGNKVEQKRTGNEIMCFIYDYANRHKYDGSVFCDEEFCQKIAEIVWAELLKKWCENGGEGDFANYMSKTIRLRFRGSWTGNYEMLTGNASDDVLARTSAEKSS